MAWPDTAVVTALGGGCYALSGIDSVLLDDGGYRIAFNADGIADEAGNTAAGTVALEWTQDTTPPDAVETLRISPDLGASYSDGVTGDASVTLLGTLPDDVATVEILVRSAAGSGTVLVPAFAPEGSELDCAVVLPGSGNLVLVVRCADAEGNVSETEMPVYLDAIPVEAEWDAVQDGRVCELAVLRFSAPVEAADVTVARLSLARDGVDVPLGGVGITALAGGLAFEVAGLDTVCAESGTYELRFDVEGVRKASSGLPMETGTVSARWTYEPVKIAGVEARQRYPWNGLVDIDYVLAGDEPDADSWVEAAVRDTRTGSVMPVWSLSGEGADGPVKAGPHRMVWDMAADRGDEFTADALSVELTARSGDAAYLVVDMGGGAAAASWPVERLPGVPAGGWTDEYKTEKLVMRWIDAGTFTMGSPTDEPGRNLDEVQHEVTLTEGFWMGVFEVTQRQWELATGSNPACYAGAARPVERVSYGMIRGDGAGAGWPASADVDEGSFLGVLRAKTGLAFDLPTDAQWEYACRAGSLGALNSDKGITAAKGACPAVAEVARYRFNNGLSAESDGRGGYDTAHTAVGSYRPNAWGLFDMHGNVAEWCLDWYDGTASAGAVTNPPGAASGTNRVYRSGHFDSLPRHVRSADRGITSPDRTGVALGLRVAVAGAASTNVVQPLAAPADVAADGTADGITVSWTASEGATGYEVWRNTADAFASATSLGTTAGTSWPDATAEPGTFYYYWVQAVDSLSASGFSASANAVRTLIAPANVTASRTTAAITVRWMASAGATGYSVWRNTKNASGSATNLGTTASTNWTDATAVPGTRYYYWVQAVSPLSTSAFSASTRMVRKLAAPANVAAAGTTEAITVGWTASTGATGYTVWRNTANVSGSATNLGRTTATSWEDATAVSGTRYYYWVKATCALSTSGFSAAAVAERGLAAPVVTVRDASTTNGWALAVSWTRVDGAASYEVWRGSGGTFDTATWMTTTNGTNWVDSGASAKTTNTYWVVAKNGTLEGRSEGAQGRPWFSLMSLRSLLTGIDAIRTPDRILSEKELNKAMSNPTICPLDGDITEISSEEMAVFRWIQRLNEDASLISDVISGEYSGISDEMLLELFNLSETIRIMELTPIVSATQEDGSTAQIQVSWHERTSAICYEVYRSTSSDGTPTLVATVTTTNWVDTDVTYRRPYWYRVKAVWETLTTGFSNKAKGYWGDWCLPDNNNLMPLRSLLTGIDAIKTLDGILSEKEMERAMYNPTIADLDGDPTRVSDAEMSIFQRIQALNQNPALITHVIQGDYTYAGMTEADFLECYSISEAIRMMTKY